MLWSDGPPIFNCEFFSEPVSELPFQPADAFKLILSIQALIEIIRNAWPIFEMGSVMLLLPNFDRIRPVLYPNRRLASMEFKIRFHFFQESNSKVFARSLAISKRMEIEECAWRQMKGN